MWVYPTVESMTAVLTWPFSLEAGLPSLSRGCCRPQKTSSHLAVNLYLLFKLKKKVFLATQGGLSDLSSPTRD